MTDISVPKGGGALAGIGETFQPDLHTGTGNFSVPIPLPPGRGSLTPQFALAYSSGSGNSAFGLGWSLGVPRISRRTERGVPRYRDDRDVFVLSGAEELVVVPLGTATPHDLPDGALATRYRPRTEAGFARIVHVVGEADDYWDVWSGDGLRSRYGTALPATAPIDWVDPAAIRNPDGGIFSWLLSSTKDTFGNGIAYTYRGDGGAQRYLETVSYADHGDPADPSYAVEVTIAYDDTPRPDPFSDCKPGFDLRTVLRAREIGVSTVGGGDTPTTVVTLGYADQTPGRAVSSRVSLLTSIQITGRDSAAVAPQAMPPLTFTYGDWDPAARRYKRLPATLPPVPLGNGLDLMDLFADGGQSVVELNGSARYWRNRGDGTFDKARQLLNTPAGASFGWPCVVSDVDGDCRPELSITAGDRTTVWALAPNAYSTDQAGFDPVPLKVGAQLSVGVTDPGRVRRLDLNHDRVLDLVVAGNPPAVAMGDGRGGFTDLGPLTGAPPPLTDFSDPRVQFADIKGDGVVDPVLVHDGSLCYWPNLGYGRFGPRVVMTDAPRFPDSALYGGAGFDPRRLLLGDVTGLGVADVVYVADGSVTVWVNQSGNGFAPPVVIRGTPRVDNQTNVRLADVDGVGVDGLLWSGIGSDGHWAFLDLTGGVKPYLLTGVDNHRGATTTLTWSTSTAYATADRNAGRPWKTTLPFPVHVLASTETRDEFANTVLTTAYDYHDGYWDPADQEFRGFGLVEHTDTLVPAQPNPPAAAVVRALDPLTPAESVPAGFDPARHGNLLRNWSFDRGRDGEPSTTFTSPPEHSWGGGHAAADEWTTWVNFRSTITTDLQPSTLPQGRGGSMIHVTTTARSAGIVQTFLPGHSGPARVVASAWVYVVKGSVGIGTGDGGYIDIDARCDRTGQWTLIQAGNHRTPANEFIVYAASDGDTEFYVDHAWIRASDTPDAPVDAPPTRTRTWFHQGPVGAANGRWADVDPRPQYWAEDPPLRPHVDLGALATQLPRPVLREALRGLRGRILRTELYARDGDLVYGDRPYEVHDASFQVVPVLDGRDPSDPTWIANPVVTVRETLSRQAIWDRGHDPMTHVTATGGYDDYGRPHAVADIGVPRGRDPRAAGDPCLATVTRSGYATRDDTSLYRLDRTCSTERHEALDPGAGSVADFASAALAGLVDGDLRALEFAYYDGPAFIGLDLGVLGDHGLPVRTEHLVITPDILTEACQPGPGLLGSPLPPYLPVDGSAPPYMWTADYPEAFRAAVLDNAPAARGPYLGYLWHSNGAEYVAGYYAQTQRISYDVHTQLGRTPRGLPLVFRDPYGGDTNTGYDDYDLLPVSVTDPVGLTTRADYDYRIFKPAMITDPNGNRTRVGYTPLGLPAWVAHLGKDGNTEGDTVEQPALRYQYNLTAFDDSASSGSSTPRQPVSVATIRRVDHRWTLVERENARRVQAGLPALTDPEIEAMFGADELEAHSDRFIRSVEFTDGLGRLLQTRTQADDLTVTDLGLPDDLSPAARTVTADNSVTVPVVVSGWNIYDNKGHPVVTYEPYFDGGYDYLPPGDGRLAGLAHVSQYYDPRGRKVRTVAPDGSETRVVFGEFVTLMSGLADVPDPAGAIPTPWETYTYDPNDNAGRTHPTSTLQLSGHWNTPSSIVIDPLGRTVRTIERGPDGQVITNHTYDIDGHPLTVTDPLGRLAASTVYDLAGQPWRTWLLDAGTSHLFRDTTGAVVEHRDDKGALELAGFDNAHRPLFGWAADHDRQHPTLRTVTIYGDDTTQSGRPPAAAREINALGRPVAVYDEAGQVTTAGYNLDGNPTSTTRRVLRPDLLLSLLPTGSSGSWEDTSYPVDWQPSTGKSITQHAITLLDDTPYQVDAGFDALGRRTHAVAPVDATGARARIDYSYGRDGGITTITLDEAPYLRTAVYDAHGRRTLAHLGNGVLLRYRYDPQSLRLRRLRAEHATQPDASSWVCDGPVLQDYTYRYDPAGNILTIGDRTPGCGIPPADPDSLDRQFTYDPLHRLLSATGRETDIMPEQPWSDVPRSQDITLARRYTETYSYDPVGNMLNLRHATDTAGTGAYSRTFTMADASNRLASVQVGSLTPEYGYDNCGNMTAETTSRHFEWDHVNRMATFRDQAGSATPSVYSQYRYDFTGKRVLKIVHRSSGPDEITVYSGSFERLLRGTIGSALARYDELQLSDHESRLVSLRRGDPLPTDPMPDQPIRYQLGDHICSTSATVGADGVLLNREEYLPYGETAFGSYARKRYRYTGKERDAESGCSYHGRRYYLTWLARWNSCDPCLPRTGTNAYRYCASNPTKFVDPTGGYEQAGHYYTVYFASLAVGFSPVVAARNAFWAQLPDQLDRLDAFAQEVQSWSPFADSNQQNWRDHVQRDIHALTGGESRPERLATTERITQGTPGTAGYGDLLHRLGDSYAHSLIDHETRLYSTGLGHAKDGHSPDKVEVRPSLYLDYTMALYGALASSASKLGLKPRMSPFEFHSWAQQVSKEPDASSQISYIRKSAAVQFAESHGLSEYAPELHEPTSLEQLRNDRYTGNMLRGVDINQINAAIPNSDSHIPAASLTR